MPFAFFRCRVHASPATIWATLVDEIEDPGKYVDCIQGVEILERSERSVVRRMRLADVEVTERITPDPRKMRVDFALLEHPFYAGNATGRIVMPHWRDRDLRPTLSLTLDWTLIDPRDSKRRDMRAIVRDAVLRMRDVAEAREADKNHSEWVAPQGS